MLEPERAIDRIRAAFAPPPGHRTLHAKGRFYRGTFTATPEATQRCRAGHMNGAPAPVVVRWSNAGGDPRVPDPKPDIRGMAVKLQDPDGGVFDLLGQTFPRFPTDDPAEFVAMTEASTRPATFPLFLARHPRMVPGIVAGLLARGIGSPVSFAEATFYPLHAYGWRDRADERTWVRYVFRPVATAEDRLDVEFSGRDRLGDEMAARLARGPVTHEVWAQIAGERHDPHRVTSVWSGCREMLAGHVIVTGELADPEADGTPTVFDPCRTVDGIELSDDPILLYRRGAYAESASRRTRSREG